MTSAQLEAPDASSADFPARSQGLRWLVVGGLGILWFRLFWKLSSEWRLDPQYAYGWAVPALAFLCWWQRFMDRPPAAPRHGNRFTLLAAVLLFLPLVPLAFLQMAYPEARPFQWFHGFAVAGITLFCLAYGRGWRWAAHFSFPIAFSLLAIPWPRGFQNAVTNSLMNAVTEVAAQVVLLLGIPVWQQGNTIALMSGAVGVSDACSGIRSLQGSLMAALFLGEHYRLRKTSRIFLVGAAVLVAFVLNVARATFLTWICASGSHLPFEQAHDFAGLTILVIVFVVVWGLARLALRFGEGTEYLRDSELIPTGWPKSAGLVIAAFATTLVITDVAVKSYFRHEGGEKGREWAVHPSAGGEDGSELPIPDSTRQYLRFSTGTHWRYESPSGDRTELIVLNWNGGEISAGGARLHSPAVCLPASGFKMLASLPAVTTTVHGVDCRFAQTSFDADGELAYVFHGIWENGRTAEISAGFDQSFRSAVKAVLEKRSLPSSRVLLVMVRGARSPAEASKRMQGLLERVISPVN